MRILIGIIIFGIFTLGALGFLAESLSEWCGATEMHEHNEGDLEKCQTELKQ
jgi:hypothetical protein